MGGGQQQCNTWATFSFFLQQRRKSPHDTVYSVSRELRVGDGCLGTSWWTELWWNVMCPALWRTEPRTLVFTSHPGSIQVLSACWEVSFGSHGWFTVSDQCWLWACGMEGGRAALSYLSPYCVKDCLVPGLQQCVGFCLLSKLCLKVFFREFWCSAVRGASVAKWFGHHSSFQLLETVWCCWAELMCLTYASCTSAKPTTVPPPDGVIVLHWGWVLRSSPRRVGVERGHMGTGLAFLWHWHLPPLSCSPCRRTRWARHTVRLGRRERWVPPTGSGGRCCSLLLRCRAATLCERACSWGQLSISCSTRWDRYSRKRWSYSYSSHKACWGLDNEVCATGIRNMAHTQLLYSWGDWVMSRGKHCNFPHKTSGSDLSHPPRWMRNTWRKCLISRAAKLRSQHRWALTYFPPGQPWGGVSQCLSVGHRVCSAL